MSGSHLCATFIEQKAPSPASIAFSVSIATSSLVDDSCHLFHHVSCGFALHSLISGMKGLEPFV